MKKTERDAFNRCFFATEGSLAELTPRLADNPSTEFLEWFGITGRLTAELEANPPKKVQDRTARAERHTIITALIIDRLNLPILEPVVTIDLRNEELQWCDGPFDLLYPFFKLPTGAALRASYYRYINTDYVVGVLRIIAAYREDIQQVPGPFWPLAEDYIACEDFIALAAIQKPRDSF